MTNNSAGTPSVPASPPHEAEVPERDPAQDPTNNLLEMAEACQELLQRVQEAEAADSILFAREELLDTVLSEEAIRLKICCLNALLAAGPAVAKHHQLLDRLHFVGSYFPLPRSPLKCRTPVADDLKAAIEILEAAADVVRPAATAPMSQVGVAPRFRASDWTQVTITFVSEHSAQIAVAGIEQQCGYEELGLADGRNGKPRGAWTILHVLAGTGLVAVPIGIKERVMVEKQIQQLRKWLRQAFGIDTDPLPFERGAGYRAAFKVQRSHAYRS